MSTGESVVLWRDSSSSVSEVSRHALIGLSLHCKPTIVILYLVPVLHPTRIDIIFMEPAVVRSFARISILY